MANVLWVGTTTYVTLKIIGALVGQPGVRGDERVGLDVPEMGIEGYSTEPVPE